MLVMVCSCVHAQDWGPWITVYPSNADPTREGVVQISFKERGCKFSPYSFYRTRNTFDTKTKGYIDFNFTYSSCDGKEPGKQRVTVFLNQNGVTQELGMWYIGGTILQPFDNPVASLVNRPDFSKYTDTFNESIQSINTSTSVLFSVTREMNDSGKKDIGDQQQILQDRIAKIKASFEQHVKEQDESLVQQDIEEMKQVESRYKELETSAKNSVQQQKESEQDQTEQDKKSKEEDKDNKNDDDDQASNNNNNQSDPPPMTQQQLDAIDLQNRIAAHKELERTVDQSHKDLAENIASIASTDASSEAFEDLGMGMTFGALFAAQGIPRVGNTSSSTNAITPYSNGMNAVDLGIDVRSDLWLLRNEFFGIGADVNVFFGYGAFGGGSSSMTSYNYNVKAHAGFRSFKAHFLWGKGDRSGSSSDDLDVSAASIGISTNTHSVTNATVDYSIKRIGGGFIWDFSDEDERFVSYSLIIDRPNFLPASHKGIKVHQIVYRYMFDIIIAYGNNYPLAGKPMYEFKSDGRNQGYYFFGIGKTFTLFKTN